MMVKPRQTKIVATLGPATDGPGMIAELIAVGMDCARVNCSYGTADDWGRRVAELRAAAVHGRRPVPVIFDLQGLKIRLVQETAETHLSEGTQVRVASADPAARSEEGALLEVDREDFAALVHDGSEIVIGDGTPRLIAERREGEAVVATVAVPGRIGPGKGVTVLNSHVDAEAFTPKDEADLAQAVALEAEFVAVSYVRNADDVRQIRERLQALGSRARVIAKIEQAEAYEGLDEILEIADGVMVARGDLGVAVGTERVPLIQKDIIRRANQIGKLVITATQMLESMISSPEPTRAEAADVANAVIDGTSAVMLSAETSTGRYPVQAVTKMAIIALEAEKEDIRGAQNEYREPRDVAVMHAALYLSFATGAEALVAPTTSGNTPRACAKYRPKTPIVAIADDPLVAAQLNLEWGVKATASVEGPADDDYLTEVLLAAKQFADIPSGALVVVTAGPRAGRTGATNLIALREIP